MTPRTFPLSPAQARVLLALEQLMEVQGYPPTVRELTTHMGYTSSATVHQHLDSLRRLGYIEGVGRRLKIVKR